MVSSPTDHGDQSNQTTDAYLDAVTIGERVPHNAPVTLAEPDPTWPDTYAIERERITVALGDGIVVLEHVGSTSVRGLPAKPIIDILLVVPDSGDEAAYVPALEAAGYTLRIREPDWHQHRLLKGPEFPVNLHVFSPGCVEIARMLGFRDHLRANPTARDRYADTKRALAAQTWTYVQGYADAKSDIVDAILAEMGGPRREERALMSACVPPSSQRTC